MMRAIPFIRHDEEWVVDDEQLDLEEFIVDDYFLELERDELPDDYLGWYA